jgi:GTPase Era involved in 16S rRNA processing
MTFFRVVAPCSLVKFTIFSELLATAIIMAIVMVDAEGTSEKLVNFIRVHGATNQQTDIFLLSALRTSNITFLQQMHIMRHSLTSSQQ